MIDSNTETSAVPEAVNGVARAKWGITQPAQEYADEAVLHYVNGQIYLSLGQLQIPAMNPDDGSLESVEILPVARIVFTAKSFHKVLAMLNKVASRIPNPNATEEAGED